jgi:DNA-binding response OmpR family regulator
MPPDRNLACVLIIDPSAPFRALTADILRANGVAYVHHAESVLTCPAGLRPTVIILDWSPTDQIALEFARSIRAGAAGIDRETPIIIATTRRAVADVIAAREAGMDEYLVKPFATAGLLGRLDAVVAKRRAFVEGASFLGPDRRRKTAGAAPRRRLADET